MKRFVFRLAFLLRVKLTLEKEQKARLAEIQEEIRRLNEELQTMLARLSATSDEYARESSTGITGWRLNAYSVFFEHMYESITEQRARIEEARAERSRRQAALLRTMKEIKTLRKLRDTQYAQYLAEVAKEEEKAIGDIVSFRAIAK